MGDAIIILALLAAVFLILRSRLHKFRGGECSGGCPGCSGSCGACHDIRAKTKQK